jgi:hypothetical protein
MGNRWASAAASAAARAAGSVPVALSGFARPLRPEDGEAADTRSDAEVGVAELALNDVERHALTRRLTRMRVTQLMRSEASPHAGHRGRAPQLLANVRRRHRPPRECVRR